MTRENANPMTLREGTIEEVLPDEEIDDGYWGKRPHQVTKEDCYPDFINAVREYFRQAHDFMSEEYIRMTSLFTLAAIIGAEAKTHPDNVFASSMKPHLMLLLLAPSSAGQKTVTISAVKDLLNKTALVHEYPELYSIDYIYQEFDSHPSGLMTKDEFVTLLDENRSKAYLSEIRQVFMKMADGNLGARASLTRGRWDASDIAPNFLSATVPDSLSEHISDVDIKSGFLARFLLCYLDAKIMIINDRHLGKQELDSKLRLVHTLRYIWHTINEFGRGELLIKFTPEAFTALNAWAAKVGVKAAEDSSESIKACYLKLRGYLYKFTVILALSNIGAREQIKTEEGEKILWVDFDTVGRAVAEADFYTDKILPNAIYRILDNKSLKLLRLITNLANNDINALVPRANIIRASHMTCRDLDKYLETLVGAEYIDSAQIKNNTNGKSSVFYKLTGKTTISNQYCTEEPILLQKEVKVCNKNIKIKLKNG